MSEEGSWSEGRAGGKVILVGEHFVVHGAPALAQPLAGVGVTVRVRPSGERDGLWRVAASGRGLLFRMVAALGREPARWDLEVRATLPMGMGLGSSAALSVALVRAFDPGLELREGWRAVRERAHRLEGLAHGTPSGIDDAVAASARPVWFRRGEEGGQPPSLEVLPRTCTVPLWVACVPRVAPTREAVAEVAAFKAANPSRYAELHAANEAITADARMLLEQGEAVARGARMGALMDRAHQQLNEVGVGLESLDRLCEASRRAGAWGAKLTGGGLGGGVIALAPEGVDLEPALREAGAEHVVRPAFADVPAR